ncbi:MAG: type IV-A pilus assembly ATPase PilB [Bdellovibrionales bacterium]|nr:type IV-A pilus assembly ATPase PilB [Bdellovibrionales bacterium]
MGDLLVQEKIITLDQLAKVKKNISRSKGLTLTEALVHNGILQESEMTKFLSKHHRVPAIDLNVFEIDPNALALVPRTFCEKNLVIPVQKAERSLVVAFADPSNIYLKDDLSLLTKCKIEIVVAPESIIKSAIDRYYGQQSVLSNLSSEIEEQEDAFSSDNLSIESIQGSNDIESEPIIKFVNATLKEAINMRASDIHIEPYEKSFRIRFRVDGSLIEKVKPPLGSAAAIVSRIKILSKMDITEKRRPQDGRIKIRLKGGKSVDFRVNSIPTLYGEKIVMRILDQKALQVDLTKLGLEDEDLKILRRCMSLPQGMILITGPTGSGKTTTIYSALKELNLPEKNISTAEDPIEYNIEGINQVQINSQIGFDFPMALRAFLRQDPEIIMVGEIRDLETAQIAFKAATTGHLVVSTLHTNDTISTVSRLIDMGIPNYMVAETISLIVAQRLLKTICFKCIEEFTPDKQTLLDLEIPEKDLHLYQTLRRGRGCDRCNYTGLFGREAVYEFLPVTRTLKEGVMSGLPQSELKKFIIQKDGLKTLRQKALIKLRNGITSIDQVLNVTVGDDIID